MKYIKFFCFSVVLLLTGCSIDAMPVIETLPVSSSDTIVINTIESETETEIFTELNSDVEITIATTTEPEVTTEIDFVPETVTDESTNNQMHLTKEDDNYKYELAYKTGDYSKLSEKEKQVLTSAIAIIEPYILMTRAEIVVAVHDRLTELIKYDYNDDQYSAYGALVMNRAVCQGYAEAFKLCMDLCGIDCITVGGEAVDSIGNRTSHAWNMIRIRENWYHVDVTWDDPTLSADWGSWSHLYLFADDDFMEQNHFCDGTIVQGLHGIDKIPTADNPYALFLKAGKTALDQKALEAMFYNDYMLGRNSMEYLCDSFKPDLSFVSSYSSCTYIADDLGRYVHVYIKL